MDFRRSVSKPLFAVADRLFESPSGPRILIYHKVGAGQGKQIEVTLDDFEWQIRWLSENRQVVDLESALNRWDSVGSDQLVVLTFDDGYLDTYATAFPILRSHDMPFTIYVATSFLRDSSQPRGWLTWAQLGEMVETGLVTIGAHTHSHVDMRSIGQDEIVQEIEMSNSLLESHLGVRPRHFAYPWGYWSETSDRVSRNEYSSAVLGAPPLQSGHQFDPYLIHRFPVQRSDGRRWFEARIDGGFLIEEEVRRRIRGYSGP